jgi:hypothetical protein
MAERTRQPPSTPGDTFRRAGRFGFVVLPLRQHALRREGQFVALTLQQDGRAGVFQRYTDRREVEAAIRFLRSRGCQAEFEIE